MNLVLLFLLPQVWVAFGYFDFALLIVIIIDSSHHREENEEQENDDYENA